ncbi:uncharacterized protein LOC110258190 isoform X2 [Sus scrofa]|uniref:uncharacterized protein LOC110258190 isoform X2 n=1 Tax=Sus scrofa TaxID=9823 RepID=UPI000A2B0CDB|nr:uncharacterized protein LOC110258190 isoform X2 [Sus scrofa]
MFKRSKNSKKHRPYMYFSLLVPWGGVSALLLWLTNPSRCWTPPLKCRVCGRPPAVLGPALGGSVQPWITDWAHKPVGVATAQRLFSLLWGLLELFQKHLDTYSWAETLLSSSAAPSTLPGRWLTAWCLSHPPDPQPRPPEWTGVSAEARGQTGPMRKRLPALPQSLLPTPARQVLQDPRGAWSSGVAAAPRLGWPFWPLVQGPCLGLGDEGRGRLLRGWADVCRPLARCKEFQRQRGLRPSRPGTRSSGAGAQGVSERPLGSRVLGLGLRQRVSGSAPSFSSTSKQAMSFHVPSQDRLSLMKGLRFHPRKTWSRSRPARWVHRNGGGGGSGPRLQGRWRVWSGCCRGWGAQGAASSCPHPQAGVSR